MFSKISALILVASIILTSSYNTLAARERGNLFVVLNSSRGTGEVNMNKGEQILFTAEARGFTLERPENAVYTWSTTLVEGEKLKCQQTASSEMACEALSAGKTKVNVTMTIPSVGSFNSETSSVKVPGYIPFILTRGDVKDGIITLEWTPLEASSPYTVSYREYDFSGKSTAEPRTIQTFQNKTKITASENRKYITTVSATPITGRERTITTLFTVGANRNAITSDMLKITRSEYRNNRIDLEWTLVQNAQLYTLAYKQFDFNGNLETAEQGLVARTNQYSFRAEENKTYVVKVEADKGGNMRVSDQATIETHQPGYTGELDKLTITTIRYTPESINILWASNLDRHENILLDYSAVDRSSGETLISESSGNFRTNTFTITNPIPNATYLIHLRVEDAYGRVISLQKRIVQTGSTLTSTQNDTITPQPPIPNPQFPIPDIKSPITFTDTDSYTLVGKAATELSNLGIITGYSDNTFQPNRLANRAETAKFLVQATGRTVPEATNNGRFTDVPRSDWYVKYVVAADNMGIIRGFSDGTFLPNRPIEVAEFIKMLTVTFNLETDLPHSFQDQTYDGVWFWRYAGIVEKYNLFPDQNPEYLNPRRQLSRGDIAVAIMKLIEQQTK